MCEAASPLLALFPPLYQAIVHCLFAFLDGITKCTLVKYKDLFSKERFRFRKQIKFSVTLLIKTGKLIFRPKFGNGAPLTNLMMTAVFLSDKNFLSIGLSSQSAIKEAPACKYPTFWIQHFHSSILVIPGNGFCSHVSSYSTQLCTDIFISCGFSNECH